MNGLKQVVLATLLTLPLSLTTQAQAKPIKTVSTPFTEKQIQAIMDSVEVSMNGWALGSACRMLNGSLRADDPASRFENGILKDISYSQSDFKIAENHPQKERLISEFFNRFKSKLTCGEETTNGWREREHILKRSISANMYHFLEKVGSSREYSMDFNYYEIIDGEKETLLDYLDKILANEEMMEGYDRDELEELVGMIEDDGGKRGRELE